MSAVFSQTVQATVALPPRELNTPVRYIKSYLDRFLLKQFPGSEGILLAYNSIAVEPLATVSYYQPEVLVKCRFSVLLYHPQNVILAEVSDVTDYKTTLLVNGVFEGELEYDKTRYKLAAGQILRCRLDAVKKLKQAMRFCCSFADSSHGIVLKSTQQPPDGDGRVFAEETRAEELEARCTGEETAEYE